MDTSSDVYALGVLLYELLTGTTPLTPERLKNASRSEAARLIREEQPPPPSKRLSESKDGLASVSAQRKTKPKELVDELHGPLDCLVLKALEKDRARRYATAHDLARDIQRYLAHESMEACPSDASTQIWRTAKEHPRSLAMMAVLFILLLLAGLGGIGFGAWEWHKEGKAEKTEKEAVEKQKKAQKDADEAKAKLQQSEAARKETVKERDEAQQGEKAAQSAEEDARTVIAFVKDRLLSAGRPADVSLTEAFWTGGQAKDVTLRKAVDLAEPRVARQFAERPLAEASVREMLGLAYLSLGEPALAVKQYKRALELREAMLGVNHPDSAECRNQLAIAYRLANRADDAGRLFDQNLQSPVYASSLAVRGAVLLAEKKPGEAELKLRLPIHPPEDPARRLDDLRGEVAFGPGAFGSKEIHRCRAADSLGLRGNERTRGQDPDAGQGASHRGARTGGEALRSLGQAGQGGPMAERVGGGKDFSETLTRLARTPLARQSAGLTALGRPVC